MKERGKQLNRRSHKDTDRVREHYEKWPFPDVSFGGREGLILMRYLNEVLNSSPSGRKRVVDVGCGTGHGTIAIARHFPEVDFVGLDLSAASIRKAQDGAEEAGLRNIDFHQGDIRDRGSLPSDSFDLAICAGVQHHIKDSGRAFANLVSLIRNSGTMILWLYGRYGRTRHNLNQAFLDLLTQRKSLDERERIAVEFVNQLGQQHVVNSGFYTPHGDGTEGLNWLLAHKQWLTDQMIPPYEHCYTMREILDLFHGNGIRFDKWLGISTQLESHTSSPLLLKEFRGLTPDEQLLAIDYLIKPEYYFVSGTRKTS
ncbi:MAG: class I SAM-dependent methyltransferase [Candidatus Zixiibacteriota bacterium]|nr:MAG: class I SAM-dependent methyltransferase [candidate division Zixibacteria bacterium]